MPNPTSIYPSTPHHTQPTSSSSPSSFIVSPIKRKTMSITQTYFLAHKARAKLSSEAARPDHNLRLLVGHANLLDSLMLELADAEREQESWFNQSVRGAASEQQQQLQQQQQQQEQQQHQKNRRVQWADVVVEEPEDDWRGDDDADDDSDVSSDASSSDFDLDEDYDEDQESDETSLLDMDDIEMADAETVPLRRVTSHRTSVTEVKETEENDDIAEIGSRLTLIRSPSRSTTPVFVPTSPPELIAEDSDDVSEDDEAMPPSPADVILSDFQKSASTAATVASSTATTTAAVTVSEQQHHKRQQEKEVVAADADIDTAGFFDDHDRIYLPPRNPARLISAISVY